MRLCIIFGAMLARLLHMVGTELKMILNVSASHLLSVMTHWVLCFSTSLFPPLPLYSLRIKIRHAYHSSHLSIIIHCRNYILPHRLGSVEGRVGLPSCLPVDIQHLIFFSNREQTVQPPPIFSLYKNVCQELCGNIDSSVCWLTAYGFSCHQKY